MTQSQTNSLKEYLGRYDEYTCPDSYYEAWKVLFTGYDPSNKIQILDWAITDIEEERALRPQARFKRNCRRMSGFTNRKYNWY